jgi:hypothetical protein
MYYVGQVGASDTRIEAWGRGLLHRNLLPYWWWGAYLTGRARLPLLTDGYLVIPNTSTNSTRIRWRERFRKYGSKQIMQPCPSVHQTEGIIHPLAYSSFEYHTSAPLPKYRWTNLHHKKTSSTKQCHNGHCYSLSGHGKIDQFHVHAHAHIHYRCS